MKQMQRVLSMIYPDQCVLCETRIAESGGLCAGCWSQTPFLTGLVCHTCGASLPGADADEVFCDDCLAMPRPWEVGRAALSYRDAGRRIVLALKHADRLDIVPACASWMLRVGQPLLTPDTLLVPIPAHWSRLLNRRYNQAAELCRGISKLTGLRAVPDGLHRTRRTPKQDGMTVDERFTNMLDAICVHPRAQQQFEAREICLIDDVMTSGATMTAATEALHHAGAKQVCSLVLARVEKAP